jgi:hypothetical protein
LANYFIKREAFASVFAIVKDTRILVSLNREALHYGLS